MDTKTTLERSPAVRARRRRYRWNELSGPAKVTLVAVSAVEMALTAAAAWDLYHRPAWQVRGPKALWWPTIFVQPVGPVAYLTVGRKHAGGGEIEESGVNPEEGGVEAAGRADPVAAAMGPDAATRP